MTTTQEWLDRWLRDAHAMEEHAVQTLRAIIGRLENYPALAGRMERHLDETERQKERVALCLERRGSSSSGAKDIVGSLSGAMQGIGAAVASDEVMKNLLAAYAFEQMEAASYRVLAAAAQAVGDAATAAACEENMREEEAMAAWLLDEMPEITRSFLLRDQTSEGGAKR